MPVINTEKRSPTQAVESYAHINLGHGDWEIVTAAVNADGINYALRCEIMYRVKVQEQWEYYNLASGYTKDNDPLIMQSPAYVTGPAQVYSVCLHRESMFHTLKLQHRRVHLEGRV